MAKTEVRSWDEKAKKETSKAKKISSRENGKKGGRPRKYKTAEELEQKILEYFSLHNTKDNIPKWPGMLNFLELTDDTLLNYSHPSHEGCELK